VKDRPILYSAAMVQALLREVCPKTQTRRLIAPEPWEVMPPRAGEPNWAYGFKFNEGSTTMGEPFAMKCPYGEPGDRLWVQEGFVIEHHEIYTEVHGRYLADDSAFSVELTDAEFVKWCKRAYPTRKTPGRFMYRSLSRIALEIESVRAEKLQEITEADAIAEGVAIEGFAMLSDDPHLGDLVIARGYSFPKARYALLWDSINGPGSWDANPAVWVITFKRLTP
jgi:hypothetical protein